MYYVKLKDILEIQRRLTLWWEQSGLAPGNLTSICRWLRHFSAYSHRDSKRKLDLNSRWLHTTITLCTLLLKLKCLSFEFTLLWLLDWGAGVLDLLIQWEVGPAKFRLVSLCWNFKFQTPQFSLLCFFSDIFKPSAYTFSIASAKSGRSDFASVKCYTEILKFWLNIFVHWTEILNLDFLLVSLPGRNAEFTG